MALTLPTLPCITWPVDVSFGQFDTTVQKSVSGREAHYINRIQPRRTYTIAINGLDSTGTLASLLANSLQTLAGFFHQCYGRALMFQFVDPDDSVATAQSFGVGDGATSLFQLTRLSGGFVESVFAPLGTPLIYVNGPLKTLGTDYTLNLNTGAVSFITPPAAGAALTWTGTYAWWCCWDDDKLDTSKIMGGIYEMQKASFTTQIL